MKLLIEIVLSILLHPLATLFCWINIAARSDLSGSKKVIWAIVCLVPVGPVLYVLLGEGRFW